MAIDRLLCLQPRINLQLSIDPYHDIISVYSDLAVRKNEPKLPNSEH